MHPAAIGGRILYRTAYSQVAGAAVRPEPGEATMNPDANLHRLARLQRECDVSAVPALLLSVACAAFVLVLVVTALQAEAAEPHATQATAAAP